MITFYFSYQMFPVVLTEVFLPTLRNTQKMFDPGVRLYLSFIPHILVYKFPYCHSGYI